MNRTRAKAIVSDIEAALLQVARKYQLESITAGRWTANISNGSLTVKLEIVEQGGVTPQAAKYNLMRAGLGLPALNSEFIFRSNYYRIIGLNKTNKVLAVRVSTGKRYRFSVGMVQEAAGLPVTDNITLTPTRRIPRRGRRSLATETRMERQEQNDEATDWMRKAPERPMGFVPPEAKLPEQPKSGKFAIDI